MKYFLFSLIIFSSSFLKGQNSDVEIRKEALEFSLSIVKTFFNEDCETYYNSISDSIILRQQNEMINKEDIIDKNRLCGQFFSIIIDDKTKSYEDYLDSYLTLIFTYDELKDFYNLNYIKKLPERPSLIQKEDLFFLGGELKNSEDDDYIFEDIFQFLIRKEDGIWVIKGI